MQAIFALALIIAAIASAVTEVLKRSLSIKKQYVPVVSILVGLALGAAAVPFTDLDLVSRLWGGGLAGLSGTGLYELSKWPKRE